MTKQLAKEGLNFKQVDVGRVLGIDMAAGTRRRPALQKQRLAKGRARANNIKRLVRLDRRACSLYTTGSRPLATWGAQALGMAPSPVAELRRQASLIAGAAAKGGCATTGLLYTFGPWGDPLVHDAQEAARSLGAVLGAGAPTEASHAGHMGCVGPAASGPSNEMEKSSGTNGRNHSDALGHRMAASGGDRLEEQGWRRMGATEVGASWAT